MIFTRTQIMVAIATAIVIAIAARNEHVGKFILGNKGQDASNKTFFEKLPIIGGLF